MSRSRDKGQAFEREVAKTLTHYMGIPFVRTAGSGAWLGGRNAARKAHEAVLHDRRGDIAGLPGLVVECKRYAKVPDLLIGPSAEFDRWLDQLEADCDPVEDQPLLAFRGDGKPAMAAVPESEFDRGWDVGNHLLYERHSRNWAVCRLDPFLQFAAQGILETARRRKSK